MRKNKGIQKNRKYKDYGGQPACQGCLVYDNTLCALFERAEETGIRMDVPCTVRVIAEKAIQADRINRRRK
jgi:hypothetical protein